jgi:hypothetical protein
LEPSAKDVDQVVIRSNQAPGRADRKIVGALRKLRREHPTDA